MDWERMRKGECPHCGKELYDDGQLIRCSSCYFKISQERYEQKLAIKENLNDMPPKMKWQNLKKGHCPVVECQHLLQQPYPDTHLVRCSSPLCTFIIREEKLSYILQDRSHPANRFHRREELQGFERHDL